MGFTQDLATGVWLGYDVNVTPLGRYETGGHAALPIWLDHMAASLRNRPQEEFEPPPGIVKVRIDVETGLAVAEGQRGIVEPFKEGTEPKGAEEGAPPKPVEVQDIFMQ
jgi:penicillin-binding protein 1A